MVSFSLKYLEYQRQKRSENLAKAEKAIRNDNADESPKDFRSYIIKDKCTDDGEAATVDAGYHIDCDRIRSEEQYDGFYAVCTNLEEYTDSLGRTHHTIKDILKINRARWEIEESFRIMKTQMRARPVYHRTDRAIKAHFAICLVALFLYRVLEHRLGNGFSTDMILDALKRMNALHVPSEGFIPAFKRTNITDKLFEMSGFRLDTEIVQLKKLNPSSPQQRDVYSTKSEKSRSSLTIDSQQLAATAISYKVSKMGKLQFFPEIFQIQNRQFYPLTHIGPAHDELARYDIL